MAGTTVASVLSAANSPPLVASLGIAAAACLPALQQAAISSTTLNLPTLKLLNLLSYLLNFISTSLPGRLDGIQQEETIAGSSKKKDPNVVNYLASMRDRSLVNPSGWAFIIWAPIFLGELLFTTTSAILVSEGTVAATVIWKASAGFVVGQIFQSLWAASFRPKYFQERNPATIFISAGMLAGIAASLSYAHVAFSTTPVLLGQYLLFFFPMSLHFGWTSAAALVNINGNVAALSDNKNVIAWTGHVSVVVATALGVAVTLSRGAPVYGGVIAWALAACSTGLNQRIQEIQDDEASQISKKSKSKDFVPKADRPGFYGARTQRWLCRIGSFITAATSVAVSSSLFTNRQGSTIKQGKK